jgi:hypothetical protein
MSDRIQLIGMELIRLRDCATSSRNGVDKGFPRTLKGLAAKGLVKESKGGYVVTTLGLETLKQYSRELKSI